MAYIVDTYNKYDSWDRKYSRFKFNINDQWYAIYEVDLEWGVPQLKEVVDRDKREEAKQMRVYGTLEEALEFVRMIKGLN